MLECEQQPSQTQAVAPSHPILPSQDLLVDEPVTGEATLGNDLSNDSLPGPASRETEAQRRRRERIELVEEFGGYMADFKKAAFEAVRRGMYSPRTNLGDIEAALSRTWRRRNRCYNR